jgi:glycine cleavage system H lipoate-binding protein
LAAEWAGEYNKINPDLQINLQVVTDPENRFKTSHDLGLFSGNELAGFEPGWKMAVGREVIVPIMNAGNPYLNEIYSRGVSKDLIARLLQDPVNQDWGKLFKNGQDIPVHIYISSDKEVRAGLEKYLGMNYLPNIGIVTENEARIIAAVQDDPYAVGFCRMNGILDFEKQTMIDNIRLLPIDKNGNGKLDNMENIYGSINDFSRGIWIGKYPKALSNEIYVVTSAQPSSQTQIEFLKWALTRGQQFLAVNGFSDLVYGEVQSKLERFSDINLTIPPSSEGYSVQKLVLIIAIAFILLSLIIGVIIRYGGIKSVPASELNPDIRPGFDLNSLAAPKGLYYDKTHTWAFMEKDGTVRVGIDDFLQHITGPVTRIEMKKPGETIKKGEFLVSIIQKGKQLNLYAPVSGVIQECNRPLATDPSALNSFPYADGWIYRIEPVNWSKEILLLNMAGRYTKWLSDEIIRLKDFLAFSLQTHKIEYFNVVLQDGGMLKDNLLEDFGPEVWEDFQTKFLDIYK